MIFETLKRWMLTGVGWTCYQLLRNSDIAWYITTNGQRQKHMVGRVIGYEMWPRDITFDWESTDGEDALLTQFSILEMKRSPEGQWAFITEEEE